MSIDLSQLPAPNIIDALDFETVFGEMLADLIIRDATFSALVEADPAYKVLEVAAYREVLIRQRVNDAAKAVMLAYALDTDLDNVGANFEVKRLLITPADNIAIPPVAAVYELDDDFRRRIQLAFEGLTTAGSSASYMYHALSADGDVKDVVTDTVKFHVEAGLIVIDNTANLPTPEPGNVAITVLSRTGDGTANAGLLTLVESAVNAEKVRPLTDRPVVRSAAIVNYAVEATLYFYDGPSSSVALNAANAAVNGYTAAMHKIGYDVTIAGLYAALKQPGVQDVGLTNPTANITIGSHQAAYCTGVTLNDGGLRV